MAVLACALALGPSLAGSGAQLGYFEDHQDVGQPALAGSTTYNAAAQRYAIVGAGTNMWAARDEFQFAWRRLAGDFIVRARATFDGAGVEPHRKLGWMVRRTLDPDSPYVDAALHGEGLMSLQYRRAPGADTEETRSTLNGPDIIQLERRGQTYIMSVARFGEPFTRTEVAGVDLGDDVYVGLFVCSHNAKVSERAVFDQVRIVVPPKEGWVPYRDYIGSNLELLTVDTGERAVVHTTPGSIQAPNWTHDGGALIYNGGGRLYRFDLATHTPAVIDTGFATSNNNDHVLSFDGRMLGISHQPAEESRRSVGYTVPVTGGIPRRITRRSPSYVHGWSPDGRFLVFTGERDDELDVYKIPAEGGDEIRLTDAKGVDDGPEYTPDGAWIYFNSARTGRMHIWRMKPDGSAQEAITNGDLNDWFPHISPDGQWIVFVSFLPDVPAGDHPFYKQVYIRRMRLDGSDVRTVAYVYGGQGTMNVPSWSPDGKRLAFVSNTALPAPH
jgi:hypothetical protein